MTSDAVRDDGLIVVDSVFVGNLRLLIQFSVLSRLTNILLGARELVASV